METTTFLPTPKKATPTTYGIGPCAPPALQFLANKKAFLVVFCLTCILQGTFHTYFVAVITTLEKLFGIPSRTVGTLMMASEVGQVTSSLFLPYYAGQGHRPRWIATGSLLFSIATLLCASPHFLLEQNSSPLFNDNKVQFCSSNTTLTCDEVATDDRRYYLFGIIFFSLLSIGFGQTAIFTLGIPYLDDNVGGKESPLYFSITIGLRILGPVSGFILGSLCTRIYINPSKTPPFPPTDPRWLGAWWLGMLIISFSLFVTSFLMAGFPSRLKSNKNPETKQPRDLKNFPKAVKRLVTNKLLVLRTFSSVFHLLPISGLYTFLPKYLESQFRLAAFEANILTGTAGILVMGVGIFGSGWVLRSREPSARFVAIWVCGAAGIYAMGIGILAFVGCGAEGGEYEFGGGNVIGGAPSCPTQTPCVCPPIPNYICGNSKTYFSPCHAGCTSLSNNTYEHCSCIPGNSATTGQCPLSCPLFPLYLTIFILIVLVHSTSEVGSMLLTLRCVEPRDKAMALGLVQCAIGMFGNVPCPVIYGAVVDKACLLWGGSSCDGGGGNCWVYDGAAFRTYFHGLTAALMSIAFMIDLVIIYKAKMISFNEEPKPQELTEFK